MSRQSRAVVIFSAAIFLAALVPFFVLKYYFRIIAGSDQGKLVYLLWHMLPIFAAIWSGLAAGLLVRQNARIGFWRGALIGFFVPLCCWRLSWEAPLDPGVRSCLPWPSAW